MTVSDWQPSTPHPRSGWTYPYMASVKLMDCGLKIACVVIDNDGKRRLARYAIDELWNLRRFTDD